MYKPHSFPFSPAAASSVAIRPEINGPMYEEEKRCAETGEPLPEGLTPLVPEKDVELPEDYNLRLINFLLPMLGLFITIFATIFITGDIGANGLRGAFMNADTPIVSP